MHQFRTGPYFFIDYDLVLSYNSETGEKRKKGTGSFFQRALERALRACYAYIGDKNEAIKQHDKLRRLDNEKASRLMEEVIKKEF